MPADFRRTLRLLALVGVVRSGAVGVFIAQKTLPLLAELTQAPERIPASHAQERVFLSGRPKERAAPVSGSGPLPLAIGGRDPGRAIEGPAPMMMLGGLVTSTALDLLVLPALALRHGPFNQSRPHHVLRPTE